MGAKTTIQDLSRSVLVTRINFLETGNYLLGNHSPFPDAAPTGMVETFPSNKAQCKRAVADTLVLQANFHLWLWMEVITLSKLATSGPSALTVDL